MTSASMSTDHDGHDPNGFRPVVSDVQSIHQAPGSTRAVKQEEAKACSSLRSRSTAFSHERTSSVGWSRDDSFREDDLVVVEVERVRRYRVVVIGREDQGIPTRRPAAVVVEALREGHVPNLCVGTGSAGTSAGSCSPTLPCEFCSLPFRHSSLGCSEQGSCPSHPSTSNPP